MLGLKHQDPDLETPKASQKKGHLNPQVATDHHKEAEYIFPNGKDISIVVLEKQRTSLKQLKQFM